MHEEFGKFEIVSYFNSKESDRAKWKFFYGKALRLLLHLALIIFRIVSRKLKIAQVSFSTSKMRNIHADSRALIICVPRLKIPALIKKFAELGRKKWPILYTQLFQIPKLDTKCTTDFFVRDFSREFFTFISL